MRALLAEKLGHIHIPVRERYIDHLLADTISNVVRPGSILLTNTRLYLTNLLIPGFYNHAAIMLPNRKVIDATSKGVRIQDSYKWLREKDYIAILYPKFIEGTDLCSAAITQAGKPYDYDFDYKQSGNKAFYCAELVYWALKQVYPAYPLELRERFGHKTITPNDIYMATDKFLFGFESNPTTGCGI